MDPCRSARLLASLLVLTLSACGGEESDTRAPLGPELIEAARAGDAVEVQELLEQVDVVDARGANGATALVVAAYGNHVEVAGLLIEAGAT